MDFLFLIIHLIICIQIKSQQVYALMPFSFYVKVPIRTFSRSGNCYLPRFDLELPNSQHATHCLMRQKQPKVPISNGRAIRIPQCWTERSFDLQIDADKELEYLNAFALYVFSRYYPLTSGEEIVLPRGLTMYLRLKRWSIEEILPKVIVLLIIISKGVKNLYCCIFSNYVIMYV